MLISVAGNIGSGKTTLTTLLAKHYKWDAYFEGTEDNPYLNDFYEECHGKLEVVFFTLGQKDDYIHSILNIFLQVIHQIK